MQLAIPDSIARSAFHGTSWTPEERGARTVAGYQSEVDTDIETLRKHATKGGTMDLLDAEVSRYVSGYRRRIVAWLSSESRCVSSWIAGPSNFPARRMQKRADVAHKRMGEMFEFRSRALKAAIRNLRPDLRPIMSGDADACERLEAEIKYAELLQARMKAANSAIRKHHKAGPEAQIYALASLNISESLARELLKPDLCHGTGFPSYGLTNNGANIRRMKQRLEKISRDQSAEVTEFASENGIRLEDDPPANRVRLFFPGKPDEAVRSRLKKQGFRWSPTVGAWQAYRNTWSMALATELTKVPA